MAKKKCMNCGKYIENPNHDYCYDCWEDLEEEEENSYSPENSFKKDLDNKIYTTYIMFYGKDKQKIGYTSDLNSRILEIRRQYPTNRLVYFREFTKESEARRFEAWLRKLANRQLMKFISTFQDKIRKIETI